MSLSLFKGFSLCSFLSIKALKLSLPLTRTRFFPKDNISFTENFTVSFVLPAGAIFEPLMSVGPEEDVVTCLNLVVAVSVARRIASPIRYPALPLRVPE